jgi:long-chain fatty acid transport protein
MKKTLLATCLFVAAASSPPDALAGSIDALSNQSAAYIRTFSRNSATDEADIVSYNPAGTAWLGDGLFLNLNNQTILKKYEIAHRGETFSADTPSLAVPSLYAVYKRNDLAAFFSFTVPAGGGSLDYKKGVPFLEPLGLKVVAPDGVEPFKASVHPQDGYFKGSSMFLAPALGAAYRFFDMVSVSAGLRLVYASKAYEGAATFQAAPDKDAAGNVTKEYAAVRASLDSTKTAVGLGGIFGVHVRPLRGLDVALRYEMETPLELEADSKLANLATADSPLESFLDGAKEKRNLPAVLGAGISYELLADLRLSASLNYYFIKQADGDDDIEGVTGYARSYDDDYENGFDLAGAVEYQLFDNLLLSLGYNRSAIGGNEDTHSDFEFSLDSHSICMGARWTVIPHLDLNFGFARTMYDEATNPSLHPFLESLEAAFNTDIGPETFNKGVYALALGIQYRFFAPEH